MLYGVKKIEFCAANLLAFNGKENVYYGVAPELLTPLTEIQCVPMARASLSIEQTVQNKEVLYTSKLQFVTDADPELAVGYYAFVVTTVAGERILIGAQLRPRVVVTTTQSVAGTAGELTAFTTSAEWTTDYKPLRLPVDNTPQADPRIFDICCGQIAQPQEPDTRVFDICCGEIVGEQPAPTLLTVIWQNYDGTEVDRKTYYEGQPEPTTTVVPTKPATPDYVYTFDGWELYSQSATIKVYRATYTQSAVQTRTIATVNGVEAVRYDYSTDGKRIQYDIIVSNELQLNDYQLETMVVVQIANPIADIESVVWNEEYLPANKTWIIENGIKIGYYVGNNQPTAVNYLYWMYNYGGNSNVYQTWRYYSGKQITPPSTAPTREGYTFKGWAATSDGQPQSNLGLMPNSDKQLWAVWEAES